MSRSGSFSNFWRTLSRASRLTIAYSGHTPRVLLLSFQDLRAVAQPNPALPQQRQHGAPGTPVRQRGEDVGEASGDSMPAGRPCSHHPRALFKGAAHTLHRHHQHHQRGDHIAADLNSPSTSNVLGMDPPLPGCYGSFPLSVLRCKTALSAKTENASV
jgi:hypothetical protein